MSLSEASGLSDHQWKTLLAIADAFVGTSNIGSTDALDANPSECVRFQTLLSDTLANRLPAQAVKETRLFLGIVSGYVGYSFNGTSAYLYDLSRDEVEKIVLGWMQSRLRPIRMGAKGLGTIIRSLWVRTCPGFLDAIGYPEHVVPPASTSIDGGSPNDVLGKAVGTTYAGRPALELTVGVLVIGSGSGATAFTGSLIRNLTDNDDWKKVLRNVPTASDVLIIEKSSIKSPHPAGKALSGSEDEAFDSMLEGGGVVTTDESAVTILAGSTWGGGSRINWSACLQTDRLVREEWTRHVMNDVGKKGDPHGRMFLGREWQDCMETVERHLGVQTPALEEHNIANTCLIEGSRRLGYMVKPVPQNIAGRFSDHERCGASCTIGCRGHENVDDALGKMSGCRAFLAPLIDDKSSEAPIVQGLGEFEIDRVIFDENDPKRAIGAVGWAKVGSEHKLVVVKAKSVVVSGGTLSSPAILLRSGVKNPHLGYHLHLHPTLIVHSTWPEVVNPWEGTILTTVINEFSNQDGKGHGVKLEAMCMLPSIGNLGASWSGAEDWKARMRQYPYTMGHIVLCREEETGRVYTDKNGKRCISYVTGTKEREWIRNGFEGLAKLLHAQGALEICTSAAGLPVWRRAPGTSVDWADDQSFLDFLEIYRKTSFDVDRIALGSAHQMGTCRMSGSARTGVVDLTGKVWGKENLYVADASVFPSASGVNPMVTTMTFGEWIGRRLAERLRQEVGLGSGLVGEAAVEAKL